MYFELIASVAWLLSRNFEQERAVTNPQVGIFGTAIHGCIEGVERAFVIVQGPQSSARIAGLLDRAKPCQQAFSPASPCLRSVWQLATAASSAGVVGGSFGAALAVGAGAVLPPAPLPRGPDAAPAQPALTQSKILRPKTQLPATSFVQLRLRLRPVDHQGLQLPAVIRRIDRGFLILQFVELRVQILQVLHQL